MNKNMFDNLDKLNNLDNENINNDGLTDGNGTIESLVEEKQETFGLPEFNKVPNPDNAFSYGAKEDGNKRDIADLVKSTKEASLNSKSKEEGRGFFKPREDANKPMSPEERAKLEDIIKTLERKVSKQNGVKRNTITGIIVGMTILFFVITVFGIMPYYEKYMNENRELKSKIGTLEEEKNMCDTQVEWYKDHCR